MARRDAPRHLQAVHVGQAQVDQEYVGRAARESGERFVVVLDQRDRDGLLGSA
jgi:hypothetical protein